MTPDSRLRRVVHAFLYGWPKQERTSWGCRNFGHRWEDIIEFRAYGENPRMRCARCFWTVETSGEWD